MFNINMTRYITFIPHDILLSYFPSSDKTTSRDSSQAGRRLELLKCEPPSAKIASREPMPVAQPSLRNCSTWGIVFTLFRSKKPTWLCFHRGQSLQQDHAALHHDVAIGVHGRRRAENVAGVVGGIGRALRQQVAHAPQRNGLALVAFGVGQPLAQRHLLLLAVQPVQGRRRRAQRSGASDNETGQEEEGSAGRKQGT